MQNRLIMSFILKSRLIFKNHLVFFFVSTLAFYEAYYEKMINLLEKEQTFQWYICPSNQPVETIKSYQKIVDFIDEVNLPTRTIIMGAGNQSIFHLCAFLKKTSLYIDTFIFFSTTVPGLSKSISGRAHLCGKHPIFPVIQEYTLPNYLIYSQPLNYLEDKMSWQEDFHSLMVLGLSTNEELYKLLREIQPTQHGVSLAPYLEKVIEIQKSSKVEPELTIANFQKGFYQLTELHYLTKNQKELMAFLLYFLWCIKKNVIGFDFKAFFLWYESLMSLDLTLPRQMITYDLAESILKELNRFTCITGIHSIGRAELMQIPSLDELYQVISTYRKIKEE